MSVLKEPEFQCIEITAVHYRALFKIIESYLEAHDNPVLTIDEQLPR